MKLPTELYSVQSAGWPKSGRHILAHFDDSSIVVYQAYRPSIGRFAIEHGYFGGPDFSLSRMSWIKPNFLWMMYRSGWATKPGQEVVLGLRISRDFFEELLRCAVSSDFDPECFANVDDWQQAIRSSEVRMQWDPDHSPTGAKLDRRAIQLGLRGTMLEQFAKHDVVEVIDMTSFAAEQRANLDNRHRLRTPIESVYPSGTAPAARC